MRFGLQAPSALGREWVVLERSKKRFNIRLARARRPGATKALISMGTEPFRYSTGSAKNKEGLAFLVDRSRHAPRWPSPLDVWGSGVEETFQLERHTVEMALTEICASGGCAYYPRCHGTLGNSPQIEGTPQKRIQAHGSSDGDRSTPLTVTRETGVRREWASGSDPPPPGFAYPGNPSNIFTTNAYWAYFRAKEPVTHIPKWKSRHWQADLLSRGLDVEAVGVSPGGQSDQET